ncbi:MAG: glycosyltransferase family 2 protein [Pseudomonadota bacterium]
MSPLNFSIIIPAKNESGGLSQLLPSLRQEFPAAEIVLVDDGSTDNTAQIGQEHGVTLVQHRYSQGNGAAIKSGARAASGDVFVFMDADGQHTAENIKRLLEQIDDGYDMVVGARTKKSQATVARSFGNGFYNWLASKIVGHKVEDLTSGFRAVRASKFKEFLYLLPNGFSYPTTITMAFFRSGYSIKYITIEALERVGNSHLHVLKDGIRFLLIIFKIGTLYSPLKMFTPIAFFFFMLGLSYYMYTLMNFGRFTNMSALLFITSVLIFLIGLVSEQVTMLTYQAARPRQNN